MQQTKYLIIGSSHAALEALSAIRIQDETGSVTLITRDEHLPYSPTILPYIVSGESDPDKIMLRSEADFEQADAKLIRGKTVVSVDPSANQLRLESGETWQYEKLLLATGATPAVPPVPGLKDANFHVIRTLNDALGLRKAMKDAKTAVVLGAGFIGTHAAENLAHAGLKVSMVEMQDQVLPWYFDPTAAGMIARVFGEKGIQVLTGHKVVGIEQDGDTTKVSLENGDILEADLLVVSTGVRPVFDFLDGTEVETDQGILVDLSMQTNVDNIWSAGDVAQAKNFLRDGTMINGILPDAVDQGRIAGMAMANDPAMKPYAGGVPINTFSFFGNQAVSVGTSTEPEGASNIEVTELVDEEANSYLKIILQDDRLLGISSINQQLDAGVMWQLILRKTDLGEVKKDFTSDPVKTGRILMSATWR